MKRLISFVIPCFNSENSINYVVDEIVSTFSNNSEFSYEIILINDGSKDCVLKKIIEFTKTNPNIKGVDLNKNYGQHAALLAGFKFIKGEIVVCLDDDGQTPANEVFKLIDEIDSGKDVVYARYNIKQHSILRNLGSFFNDRMTCWLLGKPKGLYISSYFACKRYIIDEIIKYQNPYPYMQGLVLRSTNNISNVNVNHRKRTSGNSNYSLSKLIGLYLNGFTSFSVKPLRIATYIGFVCAISGFVYGVVLIIEKLIGTIYVLGYSSNTAIMLFIGGIIMIMLGLIGEYIGRIYICINNSPQSIIRNTYNIGEEMSSKK